jgi:hypothetical protein
MGLIPLIACIAAWLIFKPLTAADLAAKIGGAIATIVFSVLGGLFVGGIILSGIEELIHTKILAIEARFSGIIPSDVREKINQAKLSGFFQEIFLLAETPKWEVHFLKRPKPTPIPRVDPLVIGYDGKRFWLITPFDMTTLEQHIANEHVITTTGYDHEKTPI